jgi:L-alanine-DL-glutamate epimerase-like enolase superfamily enzyme
MTLLPSAALPAPPLPRVRRLAAHVFRWPVETPVRTSFGVMHDRPMVIVEAEDEKGLKGWGEVWCNFPSVGAEHRARLVESVFAPLLVAGHDATPAAAFERLTRATEVLAIQAGEAGPIAQCIAGIDIALWDLAARRAREPLWRLLGGGSPVVKVYASGINPDAPEETVRAKAAEGFTAFKLKVGFGAERDLANLQAMTDALPPDCFLMADANQAWSLEEAQAIVPRLERFALQWLEEPLRADSSYETWERLRAASPVPLAGGENIAGFAGFQEALKSRVFAVMQPDMAKWGGFSGCLPVAQRILASGARFCPHYLGGGIGLVASAHLLAAAGGGGMLEVDANHNPLRTEASGPLRAVRAGTAQLNQEPGLGVVPNLVELARLCG